MGNKLRRPLAFLLSAVMVVTMSGTPVYAVADSGQPGTGLCGHHTVHTEDCGYREKTPGTPWGHEYKVNGGEAHREGGLGHTEDRYIEVTQCVHEHTPECYPEEAEDSISGSEATPANAKEREPENCPHICDKESGCITEKLDCQNEHKENGGEADREGVLDRDGGYGYIPASEDREGNPCAYECRICPIEKLIAALPDAADITEDNADQVQAQLGEILALFSELTEDEQEQIDLSRCYALQEPLDAAKAPVKAAEIPADAVAKIEKEGTETVYVTADELDAVFAESSYDGAAFTLLKDVERASCLYIKINCTLDLGGHTITCPEECVNVCDINANVTIRGEGKVISEGNTALTVGGNVTLEGGTFTGNGENYCGVYVYHGDASLSVTGQNVTIRNIGGGYGLGINDAQSVQLSSGTYSGAKGAIAILHSLTLGDLLVHWGDTRYAYFDENGTTPLTGKLEETSLTGTVMVQECEHTGEGVCEYIHTTGTTTHQRTCLACGGKWEGENCSYADGRCACGSTLAVTLPTDLNLTYNGTAREPGVTVMLDGTELAAGNHYTVAYTNNTGAGTAAVTVNGNTPYTFTRELTFGIGKKPLTAVVTVADKTYDGTSAVTLSGVTLSGVVGSDTVSVNTTGLTGTLNGSDVGSYTTVTLPRLPLTGGAASNYTLVQPTGAVPASVKIEKAPALTPRTGELAVANRQAHTYTYDLGTLLPDVPEGMSLGSSAVTCELGTVSLGGYYDGTRDGAKIQGQTLTLPTQAVESDSESRIGTITVILHTGNFQDMTATIIVRSTNRQSVDISGVTLTGRAYNGSPMEYQQTAVTSVDGRPVSVKGFVYTWNTPDHTAPVNAGNYTLTVSVDPEDQNYTGSTTIPVTIEQAEITVTAPSRTIHVGEAAPVFSAADCTITGLAQGENLKTPPAVAYAQAPNTSRTGSVTVTASGAKVPEGGNYKDQIIYENGTLTITSKPLPPAKYTVTVQAGTGGTASASPASAEEGTGITLTATPNSGYHFKEWQVLSGGVTLSGNSFTMPAANVTVKAIFEKDSNGGGSSGGGNGNSGGSSSGGDSSSGDSGSSSSDNGSSGGSPTIVARPDETRREIPTTSQTRPETPDINGNVTVDNGTVQSAINTAQDDAQKNGNTANGVAIVIPIAPQAVQNSWGVTITPQTLDTLVRENVKRLEINIGGVAAGEMDTKLLQWLDTLSANGNVMFRVKRADPSGLSEEAKAAIGTRPVYDLSLAYLSEGKEMPVTDFGGHTIAVRLPYAPAKEEQTGNLYAVCVDGQGKVEWLAKSGYDPGQGAVVFETGHFSIYGIGYRNPAPAFTDIKNH